MFLAPRMDFPTPGIADDWAVITPSQCAFRSVNGRATCCSDHSDAKNHWSDGKNHWQVAHVLKYDCGVYG